jgi:hypothetical protein
MLCFALRRQKKMVAIRNLLPRRFSAGARPFRGGASGEVAEDTS